MANLGAFFRADDLPESSSFEPVPAGTYTAQITEATVRDTQAGTGQYITVRWDITGPTHQGRVIWSNLNIRNPSEKAEEIGRRQLGEIMRAIGLAQISDSDQLVGGSLRIKVRIRPARDGYDASNDVTGFAPLDGGSSRPSVGTQSAQGGRSAAPGSAPWAKKPAPAAAPVEALTPTAPEDDIPF